MVCYSLCQVNATKESYFSETEACQNLFPILPSTWGHSDNDNNILLRTHGPYHRHKSTKSGKLYISAHYRNGVCTWPTLRGAKCFILTTAVSSFTRAQKMDNHTVAHHTTGVSTCPTLRGAKHFPSTYFLYAWCVHSVHIFLLHKSNTGETQTPKQFTDNYCIRSPPYKSVG